MQRSSKKKFVILIFASYQEKSHPRSSHHVCCSHVDIYNKKYTNFFNMTMVYAISVLNYLGFFYYEALFRKQLVPDVASFFFALPCFWFFMFLPYAYKYLYMSLNEIFGSIFFYDKNYFIIYMR